MNGVCNHDSKFVDTGREGISHILQGDRGRSVVPNRIPDSTGSGIP